MATRQSVDECIQKCEDAIRYAQEQYKSGTQQEHYHDQEYTQAMQGVEEAINDVMNLANSANAQQRDQLHRMRLQLQNLQNEMILLDHDPSTVGGKLH
ncbi:YtzC family protein [Bacillus seohaeanensis]|uniref:YtzC family protein n=1 Tax=Bacillus seohaeanensis TaxID=284580 RepID=A0ABW5RSJ7_9BACI